MPTVTHIIDTNLPIYATGNQTISGVKNFISRPTFSGLDLMTTGDLIDLELQVLGLNNIVYTTGNQTISGTKIFDIRPNVNGTGVLLSGEASSTINLDKFEWVQKQKITNTTGIGNQEFGFDIVANNDVLVISSPFGGLGDQGKVFIYTGNSNNGWTLKQEIISPESFSNFYFGTSIAIDNNNNIIIGETWNSFPLSQIGAAWVYTGNATNGWGVRQKLTGDKISSQFGFSVATNSDSTIIAMGGYGDNDGGTSAGATLIYTGNATAGWQLRQKLTGDSADDYFGYSVATNALGTVLMMGGYADDDGGNNAGAALIYTGNATAGWQLRQKLTGDSADDYFGTSVATNSDGTVLMIGGIYDNAGGTDAGAAWIYTGNSTAGWQLRQKLTGNSNQLFGQKVNMNLDGSILTMGSFTNNARALIYTGNSRNGWIFQQELSGGPGASFERGLCIDKKTNTIFFGNVGGSEGGEVRAYPLENYAFKFNLTNQNFLYIRGNTQLDGQVNFDTRPTVNGIGLLLSGEGLSGFLPNTIVYTTGNQTLSGTKTFTTRPTVNGTGVLLSGEIPTLPNTIVYTIGNQTISGAKTFINTTRIDSIDFIRNFRSTGSSYNFTSSGVFSFIGSTGTLYTGWNLASINPSDDSRSIRLSSGSYVVITVSQPPGGGNVISWEAIPNTNDLSNKISFNLYSGNTPFRSVGLLATQTFSFSGFLPREYNRFVITRVGGGGALALVNISGDFGINNEIRLESRDNRLFLGNSGILFQGEQSITTLPDTIVYTTGNQTLSGTKTFTTRPTVNGTGVLLNTEAEAVIPTGNNIISGNNTIYGDQFVFSGVDVLFIDNIGISSGQWQFSNRPSVNGTGILLSNECNTNNIYLYGGYGALSFSSSSHTPALNGQTYYFALANDLGVVTNPNLREFRLPYGVKIVGAAGGVQIGGSLGDSFGVSAQMFLYNKNTATSQNLLNTGLYFSQSVQTVARQGLNIDVLANNPYVISVTTPIFNTGVAPSAVRYHCILWITN